MSLGGDLAQLCKILQNGFRGLFPFEKKNDQNNFHLSEVDYKVIENEPKYQLHCHNDFELPSEQGTKDLRIGPKKRPNLTKMCPKSKTANV